MTSLTREQQVAALEKDWAENPRWKGIKRGYSAADVVRLRGSFPIEHTIARRTAEKLWDMLPWVALVLALIVIVGLVAVVRVLRKTDDITSFVIAVVVGMIVTLGPLAFLLTSG